MRTEVDPLGALEVPDRALYGIHTQRALLNFPTRGQRTLGSFTELVDAIAIVKHAAALANAGAGLLDSSVAEAISTACSRIVGGDLYGEFPIHSLHGGGGTSANMNANEVVANLAAEALGGRRGDYSRVDPLLHVNLNQSTNDVIPTACRLAIRESWRRTTGSLERLEDGIGDAVSRFGGVPRLARTCLQDAAAITYADFLGGCRSLLERHRLELDRLCEALGDVSLGGTFVGRAEDAPESYRSRVGAVLRELARWDSLRITEDFFDATQNLDDMARVSGAAAALARGFVKIAQDLRLLASGPEGGIGEIRLAPRQAGSSVAPGKVNPVLPEHVIQLSFKAEALARVVHAAEEHAELDLNVWEMAAVTAVLEQFELIEAAADALRRAFDDTDAVEEQSRRHAGATSALLADVRRRHGYEASVRLVAEHGSDPEALRRAVEEAYPDVLR